VKNDVFWNVTSCGLVITDVSEECIASIIRVKRIGGLGKALAVIINRSQLRKKKLCEGIAENGNLHSRRLENLKSY
jgi:hypothetical protein